MTSNRSRTAQRGAASFVALGCVGFIASAPAMAQDQEPTRLQGVTVTDTAVEDSYTVEEVSSPKYTAPLVDTPRTVNIITEDVLKDTASFSLQDAFRNVPGITLGAGEGGTASADIPFIRGVDATGDVFVDGVRDVGSQTREVFALESVEVAKGPNMDFGGRGAAAGAINLVTKAARAGNFGSVSATGGTSDLVRIVGDINREVNDQVAVRLVGMYHDSKTPGRDHVHDDRWGINPSVSWGLNSPVSLTLDYYHLEGDKIPDYGLPLTGSFGTERHPADVDPDNFYGLLSRDFQKTNVDAFTAKFEADLSDSVTLSNITRYSDTTNRYIVTNPDDSRGNVADGYVWRNTKSRGSHQYGIVSNTNLSAIFNTGSIQHSLATGFEFNDTDSRNANYSVDTGSSDCATAGLGDYNCTDLYNPDPTDPWAGEVSRNTSPSKAGATEYSLYAFDTITIVPAFMLNGGVRWTSFKASGSGSGRGGPYDVSNKSDFWSWQGGAVFKPTENTSLYFSYADSKTPPGTSVGEGSDNIGSNNALYEPQSTENWEVGAKAELFERALLLSAAAFRVNRSNIQQRDPTGDVTEIFDSARLEGFEVSATGTAGPVSMMIGYTYVDSELRDESVNSGNYLPQTAKHNFAGTIDWQVTPQFSIGGGANGVSKRYADAGNLVSADGYVRFDAHAEYEINDTFGVRVNVNNITDKRYIVKLRNPHFAVPAAGRQAIVTLTARY
ncbi:TonB-dependent siderophore receptor [Altericroceibacterium spongiae]|uniref:TonB-dependent siderophore receptor n=1 Tax=Altericroceibacterium spongiae TaxID=2320269 RepID=A0A420ER75_9SPHN|nr:TonB-dependent siderophore receptor [Altericroceibacterium spongiae]RKF23187.1 TonB-dependent siderophore receptor [Altericroceibacterium spongiae]